MSIIEIKSTQTVSPQYFKGLDYFDNLANKQVTSRTLVYGGAENQERTRYSVRSWQAL